jgi:hypothetical protein
MSLLERCYAFEMRAASGSDNTAGDGLTLEGYAAVFNTPTRIDSWEGTFDEQIAPGAFKKTLRESPPVMQFDHGRHPMVGSIPIAAIDEAREDGDIGVYVRAAMADNWLVQPVRDAIANGSINGMSFRFTPIRETWAWPDGRSIPPEQVQSAIWGGDPNDVPIRTIKELRAPELGPVVFPAYTTTSVAVRSTEALAVLLRDNPDLRADLARLLASGTSITPGSEGEPGGRSTPPDPAAPGNHPADDTEGAATAAAAAHARHRALVLAGVKL